MVVSDSVCAANPDSESVDLRSSGGSIRLHKKNHFFFCTYNQSSYRKISKKPNGAYWSPSLW